MRNEKHRSVRRYVACVALVLVIALVFELRLAQWQLLQGGEYEALSAAAGSSTVKMEATRGEILDRNGDVLAGNRTVYNVVVSSVGLDDEELNEVLAAAITLLESRGEEWVDKLPIQRSADGEYAFKENRENDIAYMKGPYMLNMQSYATAQDCMEYMTEDESHLCAVLYA